MPAIHLPAAQPGTPAAHGQAGARPGERKRERDGVAAAGLAAVFTAAAEPAPYGLHEPPRDVDGGASVLMALDRQNR